MFNKIKNYLRKKPALRKLKDLLTKKLNSGKYPDSWPTLQPTIKHYAEEAGVINDVHDADYLFHHLLHHRSFKAHQDAVQQYFNDGAQSSRKLFNLLCKLGVKPNHTTTLLEFASGYGMVTRHLVKDLAPIRIVSCDIHEQAIHFLKSTLGIETILSQSIPENLKLNDSFDVVFALSFFSHMPDRSFGRWLKTLFSAVKPHGYLVFTTHGQHSAKMLNIKIPTETGIHFQTNSEQRDLDVNEYGSSFVTSEYVSHQVKKNLCTTIFSHTEASWWRHQDLYIIHKSSACTKNG
jgi:cyclopropane fatty-acyl-phospholipid synthase-like methyltransferase